MDRPLMTLHAKERLLERCMGMEAPYSQEMLDRAEEYFFYAVKICTFTKRYFLDDFDAEAVVVNNHVLTIKINEVKEND